MPFMATMLDNTQPELSMNTENATENNKNKNKLYYENKRINVEARTLIFYVKEKKKYYISSSKCYNHQLKEI